MTLDRLGGASFTQMVYGKGCVLDVELFPG